MDPHRSVSQQATIDELMRQLEAEQQRSAQQEKAIEILRSSLEETTERYRAMSLEFGTRLQTLEKRRNNTQANAAEVEASKSQLKETAAMMAQRISTIAAERDELAERAEVAETSVVELESGITKLQSALEELTGHHLKLQAAMKKERESKAQLEADHLSLMEDVEKMLEEQKTKRNNAAKRQQQRAAREGSGEQKSMTPMTSVASGGSPQQMLAASPSEARRMSRSGSPMSPLPHSGVEESTVRARLRAWQQQQADYECEQQRDQEAAALGSEYVPGQFTRMDELEVLKPMKAWIGELQALQTSTENSSLLTSLTGLPTLRRICAEFPGETPTLRLLRVAFTNSDQFNLEAEAQNRAEKTHDLVTKTKKHSPGKKKAPRYLNVTSGSSHMSSRTASQAPVTASGMYSSSSPVAPYYGSPTPPIVVVVDEDGNDSSDDEAGELIADNTKVADQLAVLRKEHGNDARFTEAMVHISSLEQENRVLRSKLVWERSSSQQHRDRSRATASASRTPNRSVSPGAAMSDLGSVYLLPHHHHHHNQHHQQHQQQHQQQHSHMDPSDAMYVDRR